ncbi:DUF2062 domain-containing protein [Paraferrimonas sp. SM1919]|uniref:DUF2062 domain-containing protein n=1 Tax=Paraferrimonas sp. SM1919 TaxID=2662263 RepID=UPI0013D0D55D|nr:DUF2062 domain-containing protein [Paraferrimonas sp. SM1919]
MPKKFIERIMPDHNKLQNNKYLKMFGPVLLNANLWHLNRRSARAAFAIGLFTAWLPIPFQMVVAAALAIMFAANLPLSVALVWITNPLTMPIMFYGAYLVGVTLLGVEKQEFAFEISWQWIVQSIDTIGAPFLIGCLFLGVVFSILSYFAIDMLWRRMVIKHWRARAHSSQK